MIAASTSSADLVCCENKTTRRVSCSAVLRVRFGFEFGESRAGKSDPGLKDKVVLITGANNPLIPALQKPVPLLPQCHEAIRETGAQAYACEADLSNASRASELFTEAERSLGPVEVLINNAACWHRFRQLRI